MQKILFCRSCFSSFSSKLSFLLIKTSLLTSKELTVFNNVYLKKYMHVELSDEVCCKIVTANKHTEISIGSAEYYVRWPSTVG